jgi:hypothetical protein
VDGLGRPEVAGQATGPASQDARARAQAVRPAVSAVPSRDVRGRRVPVEMMLGRIGARRPAGAPVIHAVSPRARVVNDVRTPPSRRPAEIGAVSPAAAPELFASRRIARRRKRGELRYPVLGMSRRARTRMSGRRLTLKRSGFSTTSTTSTTRTRTIPSRSPRRCRPVAGYLTATRFPGRSSRSSMERREPVAARSWPSAWPKPATPMTGSAIPRPSAWCGLSSTPPRLRLPCGSCMA